MSIDPVSAQMKVGDVISLGITGISTDYEWSSSDTTVATVFYGVVTARAIGKAIITAKSGKSQATCNVFVSGANGSTLRIMPYIATMKKGETFQFTGYNTFDLEEEWTSSNPEIATVSSTGLVTALKAGNSKITLRTAVEEVSAYVAVEHKYGEYKLVWSEEFNGTELDLNTWNIETGGGGWGNREKQNYTKRPENIRVKNGCLEIEARKESYGGNEYTSGRMQSKNKKMFLYGKFESRIKFPGGGGTWPAFWMMGVGSWPACGEIDIQEHVGNITKRASSALHTPLRNGSKGNNWSATRTFDFDLAGDFHIYGCEWLKEEQEGRDVIRFYVDDVVYGEAHQIDFDNKQEWPFNTPFYFIYNLAIGGTMGGNVDDNIFNTPRIMYVDWLRVYQRDEIE